jgi:hypothetical protein
MAGRKLTRTQCMAIAKQSGERCKASVIPGGNVCGVHGGKSPQAGAAALVRVVGPALGTPIEGLTPSDALLELIRVQGGVVRWYRDAVAGMTGGMGRLGDLDAVVTSSYNRETGVVTLSEHPLVTGYRAERKLLGDLSTAAVRIGIEARLVDAAVKLGETLADALVALTVGLGLDPTDQRVRTAIEAQVRAAGVALAGVA